MAPLSIAAQDAAIRRAWPAMRTLIAAPGWGVWRGVVKPFAQAYEIEISYVRPAGLDGFTVAHAWFPEVRVLSPRLSRRPGEPDKPIPHIYVDAEQPDLPLLCLFDPRAGGWNSSEAIAETILPWAIAWLGFYELWHATGVWHGGGAPHDALATGREDRDPLRRLDRAPVRAWVLARSASPDVLIAAAGPTLFGAAA